MANERLRLTRFDLKGTPMVDIRYWKESPIGPKPTKKGIEIKQRIVTQVIWALQKVHADACSQDSKEMAGVEG